MQAAPLILVVEIGDGCPESSEHLPMFSQLTEASSEAALLAFSGTSAGLPTKPSVCSRPGTVPLGDLGTEMTQGQSLGLALDWGPL